MNVCESVLCSRVAADQDAAASVMFAAPQINSQEKAVRSCRGGANPRAAIVRRR